MKNTQEDREKLSFGQNLSLYLHDLVYTLCFVLVLFMLVFRIVIVSGPSMNSTLHNGDLLLLLSNSFYRQPQAGDVVVAAKADFDNGKPIVKRVIALEGQTVDIDFKAGIVYVDSLPLDEPYTNTPTNLREGVTFPVTVEKGKVFVMGDNRNNSKDSRSTEIGQVDTRELLGKVLFLVYPSADSYTHSRDFSRMGAVK